MLRRQEITREQAQLAMRSGEFDASVRAAGPRVAVILSQDWCWQWAAMDQCLREMAARPLKCELIVFHLLYNRWDFFREFLRFKEEALGNDAIPYVRYYRDGVLIGQSNYVSEQEFLRILC
jgi:hypothetical protein